MASRGFEARPQSAEKTPIQDCLEGARFAGGALSEILFRMMILRYLLARLFRTGALVATQIDSGN
jgi:hypothetical protein